MNPTEIQNPEKAEKSFWFGFGSPVALGVFRILGCTWLLVNLILLSFDFTAWFTERGFVPIAINDRANPPIQPEFTIGKFPIQIPFSIPRINLLEHVTDPRVTLAFWILVMVATALTLIGYKTRISSIVMAVGIVTIQHRNILILHGGDTVMRLTALYIALAPSGAACSLDRIIDLWTGRQKGPPREVSLWPQRIIQFNLALIYFTTWWYKMDGSHWRDGTAVWYTSRLREFFRFPYPNFIHSLAISRPLSFATVVIELSMGTLVFYRPLRKYVLLGGLFLHATIEYTMNIPMFSVAICSMYICFYEGEEITAWAARIKFWITRHFPRAKRTVRGPEGTTFDLDRLAAIEACHPFADVTYETGDGPGMTMLNGNGQKTFWLDPIAKPIGGLPFLWKKLVIASLIEKSNVKKSDEPIKTQRGQKPGHL